MGKNIAFFGMLFFMVLKIQPKLFLRKTQKSKKTATAMENEQCQRKIFTRELASIFKTRNLLDRITQFSVGTVRVC